MQYSVYNKYQIICGTIEHTRQLRAMGASCDLCAIRKQGKSALIPHIIFFLNAPPRPEVKTAANMHHRCCFCIIDNVAFAKENTNEIFEAIKNLSLTAPTTVSRATDKEENKQVYHKYREPPAYKPKLDENKQKKGGKNKKKTT